MFSIHIHCWHSDGEKSIPTPESKGCQEPISRDYFQNHCCKCNVIKYWRIRYSQVLW